MAGLDAPGPPGLSSWKRVGKPVAPPGWRAVPLGAGTGPRLPRLVQPPGRLADVPVGGITEALKGAENTEGLQWDQCSQYLNGSAPRQR
jgi:hypothetical protein